MAYMTDKESAEYHQKMLEHFIENSDGLKGMVLAAIRDLGHETGVEVYAGASQKDMLRVAAAILDATVRSSGLPNQPSYGDARMVKAVAQISDVLLRLAGDDPDDVGGHGTGGLNVDEIHVYDDGRFKRVK